MKKIKTDSGVKAENKHWFPSAKWHACVLAVLLLALGAGYAASVFIIKNLKEPYAPRVIDSRVTPWKNRG